MARVAFCHARHFCSLGFEPSRRLPVRRRKSHPSPTRPPRKRACSRCGRESGWLYIYEKRREALSPYGGERLIKRLSARTIPPAEHFDSPRFRSARSVRSPSGARRAHFCELKCDVPCSLRSLVAPQSS
jgi:hypothetical protein